MASGQGKTQRKMLFNISVFKEKFGFWNNLEMWSYFNPFTLFKIFSIRKHWYLLVFYRVFPWQLATMYFVTNSYKEYIFVDLRRAQLLKCSYGWICTLRWTIQSWIYTQRWLDTCDFRHCISWLCFDKCNANK